MNLKAFPRQHRQINRTSLRLIVLAILLLLIVNLLPANPFDLGVGHVSAAPLPPAQFFYVPLPEAQVRTSMYTINSATGNNMHTVLGISITANSTVVWYDHWEDGYELALGSPAQASTRIWGDGNVGNGDACALAVPATLCSGDVLSSGAVLILENNVPLPRNPATILYDGRDKIGANKVVAVTQSGWEQTPATLLADAIEVIDVSRWSTEYRLPIGENLSASSYQVFEYVSLFVMASQNGTTVQIDRDGNGSIDITTTLNQGESYQLTNPTVGDLTSNARITSSKPVQVNLVTGDIGSNYENRWFAISPNTLWDSSYYTAVGTVSSAYAAHVWVFNPDQSSAITVNYTTQAGSGSFNVPAKSTYRFAMPSMTGAHFYTSGAPFLAVGTMDSGSTTTSKNQTYDWGYTLLPESFLTNVLALGWAPGSDDKYAPPGPDENTSPVWVTAVAPARVYVDFDGNPSTGPLTDPSGRKYDIHYDLGAFQSQRVYDTSGDNSQTGMRLYTLDGTLITAAWGEDPTTAKPGSPGMDIGYSVPPLPRAVAKKTWSLYADNVGGNGVVDPGGDELEYAITAKNNGAFTIFNTIISDTVPSNVTYVLNSTEINNLAYPDDGVGTPYPLDEGGINLGALNVGQTAVVTFRVTTNAGLYSEITNTAYVETDDDFLVIELRTPVNTPATTACTLDFTNSSFSPVSFYVQNGTVYLEVDDGDQNLNTGVIENVSVLVQDPTTGDRETIALSETDVNTGLFRGSIPSSTTLGQAVQDGTLHALGGDTITADYTDPLYGDACNDTAVITVPSLTKQLYLSTQSGTNPTNNGNQELDRIDPVASADGTTALSPVLGTSSGTITVDGAATSGVETVDSTINFNHTTGNGANRLMLVGVAYECSGSTCAVPPTLPTPSVSSVTFNTSFNLSLVGRAYNSVDAVVEIWAGFNPPANITNGPIVVTMSDSSVDAAAGAITYANVDPGQTLTFFGNVGNGGTLQRTGITSAAGELVFDTVAWDDIPAGASTPGSGQSSPLWTANAGTNGANAGVRSSASTKPGASPSVTMSWTPSTGDWAIGAVSIKPAPAGVTSTSFTQTPDMAKPFSMPVGGQVSVNAHVNIISGSMPANPNITAVLKYGATTFATLTNPTYSGGIVTWTGVLGSNVTTPAGQSIILEITTNQAGVTFQIRYDSTTYPSKVNLPTTTVIKVDSLTVYDAAYAGGSSISNGFNGQTVYIRPVVSDPFGAYDITDVALTIKQPASCGGATVVSTVLTDSNVVTPNPIVGDEASKTYEYVWATPGSCEGEYSIQVVTHEGLEATITDSSTLLFDVRFEDVGTPSTTEFTDGDNGPGAEVYDPDEQVCVRVTDADQNQDPGVAETVDVVITSASGDSETVTLTETDVDTGVFTGCIPADSVNPGTDEDGELYAQPGDNLLVTYEDPNDPSDTSSDTAVVRTLTPQIAINKVLVDPASGPALVGQTVRFDILVSNPGPTQLTTVGLVDTFDDVCFDFDSASVAPNGTTSSTLTWTNIGPLAANGGSTTISVYFTATAACNPANNSAQASGTDQFGTPVGPVSDPATVVISTIDIEITKTLISPNPGPATVGDPVTFTIIVTNTGLITLETIPLEDSYSNACLNFSSASPTPDGAGGGIIQWYDITGGGSLTTGNSVALTVGFVAAGPCSPTTNIATVSGAGAAGGAPQAPSGQDDADVSVVGEPPEIEISKTITAPADGVALVGDTITFTVLITNTGPNAITSLVLTDTYDSNYLTLTSWDPVTPTQQSPGQAVWNTIIPNQPPLLPGETMTVTLDFSAEAEVNLTTNVMAAAATDQFDQIAPVVNDDADVQLALEAAIGGGVYHDLNGNGVFDSGEPPLDNVLITLSNGLTTVTDASGLYTFTVKPGSYTITETNPAGYISTGAMQGTVGSIVADDDTIQVTLGSGQTSLQNNFLDARPNTAIGDYVWYDANQDGIQDVTEPGIANVTLRLYRDDGDGNFEPGTDDALVAATTTDADGGYLFAHLSPGPYFVDVDESSPALTDLTPVSGPQSEVNYTGLIMVASGETYRNADFGFVQEPEPGNVIIGDRVWIDANSNGKQDPGELGLPGVTVVILDEGDNIIGIDVTDSNGVYRIEVPAGTGYKATPFDPGGYTPTTTKPLPLPDLNAGDQYLDADFGYTKPGLKTIAGLVFEDTANNGVYDSGSDNVIAGITVDLIADSNGNGILDAGEPTIATASTGSTADGNGNNYAFVGLPAAKYLVRVSDTQNVLNSFEAGNLGTAGADDNSQAQPYAVDLTSASTNLTADFGYTRAGSIGSGFPTGIIGNQIWYDPDGDGLFEPANGEAGIAGVTIELYLGGSLVATTTTGSSGNYIFTELAAGTYTVTVSDDFDVLAGYLKTSGTDGADDNSQDDPYTVTLASDTDFDFTADFGYALPVTIGDFIYLDSNGNGVQDPSETTGIGSGVPVTLTDAVNNVISTTIAGPTGYYTFTNILPGTFKVIVPSTISGVTLTSVNPINVTLISGQTYLDADFGYIAPTAVGIVSFTAMAEAAGVRLYWQTGLEQDLEGFVVLRSTAIDGAYKAISDLIPAMNDPSGASYEWLDTSVDFESLYWYRLQAQPDGEVFGPIPSREDPGSGGSNRVFVPFVMR